jgi:hypothetical protein
MQPCRMRLNLAERRIATTKVEALPSELNSGPFDDGTIFYLLVIWVLVQVLYAYVYQYLYGARVSPAIDPRGKYK